MGSPSAREATPDAYELRDDSGNVLHVCLPDADLARALILACSWSGDRLGAPVLVVDPESPSDPIYRVSAVRG